MEIDSELKVEVSEEGMPAMQTEATTSSGTNSTGEGKDEIARGGAMSMLRHDKSVNEVVIEGRGQYALTRKR
ncbi:hypothetical protein Tco_0339791 [Tanacetum coccineum]